jgi:hypothetical protein
MLKRGERLEGVITKDGYQPTRVSQKCEDDVETKAVLRRP